MAEDKEAFLNRWSRLKKDQAKPVEKVPPGGKPDGPAPTLPPVDKLTPESDFTGFMHPKVEDALRRVALKKLFADPHFNIPDPYEAYSGDWTVGEPISDEFMATLNQAKQLLFSDEQKPKEEDKPVVAQDQPTEEKPKEDEPGRKDA
jgi:hypothetical protein